MIAIFILIFAVPVIAIIALIAAIIWGVVKSKNPKKYFITLGCIVVGVLFLVSMAFIDYETIIVNAFYSSKIPAKYKTYDSDTTYYSKKRLDGDFVNAIFTDSLTHNLIVVTRNDDLHLDEFYHRIDTTGRLLGSFKSPDYVYQNGRCLVGSDAYCDWINTGDTTLKAFTPIKGVLSREAMRSWYNAADYVRFFSDSICVLHKDDVWYSCKQDFAESNYPDDKEFPEKMDYAYAHIADKEVDIRSAPEENDRFYDSFLSFNQYPATLGDSVFTFEYFVKESYYSGFSSLFSGIGSPTGGGSHYVKWYGMAFCKLRIGDKYIPLVFSMEYRPTTNLNDKYAMNLSIYLGANYAILSEKYCVNLITLK